GSRSGRRGTAPESDMAAGCRGGRRRPPILAGVPNGAETGDASVRFVAAESAREDTASFVGFRPAARGRAPPLGRKAECENGAARRAARRSMKAMPVIGCIDPFSSDSGLLTRFAPRRTALAVSAFLACGAFVESKGATVAPPRVTWSQQKWDTMVHLNRSRRCSWQGSQQRSSTARQALKGYQFAVEEMKSHDRDEAKRIGYLHYQVKSTIVPDPNPSQVEHSLSSQVLVQVKFLRYSSHSKASSSGSQVSPWSQVQGPKSSSQVYEVCPGVLRQVRFQVTKSNKFLLSMILCEPMPLVGLELSPPLENHLPTGGGGKERGYLIALATILTWSWRMGPVGRWEERLSGGLSTRETCPKPLGKSALARLAPSP
ncbi:hypothetical protein THAOC_31283, partial [Thalassiosira oceanica]